MDMRSWKKILLQWITECGFMERNYFNIEQSDIDTFFLNFCEHHRLAAEGEIATTHKNRLTAFLQEHYPNVELHLDDENVLSSADYIYIYSLLLHFSCVKYPEPHFHEICQKLPEQTQQCIASFFKQLIDCASIDKEHLRHAIAHVAEKHLSPRPNESYNSNNSSNNTLSSPNSIQQQQQQESPARTPKRRQATSVQKISPSTPKSFLLEERTRELYNLRAQLDTERYEKGLLEVQIKQNEDKIRKLNQDHRKLQQQIQDLKNDILSKTTENCHSNHSDDEQIKRRLCKEISQKEQEISKLTDVLSSLKEEKNLIHEKLKFAERQVIVCMDRIKELDYKVDDLTAELEQKNGTIKYLTDNKLELEHFISETRSASSGSRHDFNVSADCLDTSFARATNSSGSLGSPENLGCSVIDIQLREKETENCQLKEELSIVRKNNICLAKHIQKLIIKHSEEYELNIESIMVNDNDFVNPAEHFLVFTQCVETLCGSFKDEKSKAQSLQEYVAQLEQKNEELLQRLDELENEMQLLQDNIQSAESSNMDLQRTKSEMHDRLMSSEKEIETLNTQKFELITNLESMANDYDLHKVSSRAQLKDFTDQIEKLESGLAAEQHKNAAVMQTNQELSDKINEMQAKLKAADENIAAVQSDHEAKLAALNEKLLHKKEELETCRKAEHSVKEKYEKLFIQCENLRTDKRQTDEHLEKMCNELAVKEMEMGKIGSEIVEVHSKNFALEERLDALMQEYKADKKNSETAINKKEDRIKELLKEKTKMHTSLKCTLNELEVLRGELKRTEDEYQMVINRLKTLNSFLQVPFLERNLYGNLGDTINKVKELFEYRLESSNRIEALEFQNIANQEHIRKLEEQLQNEAQEKEQLHSTHKHTFTEYKEKLKCAETKLNEYETKINQLEKDQADLTLRLEEEIQLKNIELECTLQKATATYDRSIEVYESELQKEKELTLNKERELKANIFEYNELKEKSIKTEAELEELKQESARLETNYLEKIKSFQAKITYLTAENNQLISEIDEFKVEHNKTEKRLIEADKALGDLSDLLTEENASKSELDLKLKASENRLLETEIKLEHILKEKSNTLNELHMTFESQTNKLKNAEKKIESLEIKITEYLAAITQLQNELQKVNEEKLRMIREANSVQQKTQSEQADKSKLLATLEETVEKLRLAVAEKEKEFCSLEESYSNLEKRLAESQGENMTIQTDLVAKKTELCFFFEEQKQERNNMELQQGDLMRKLAEQSLKLEANDNTLIEIIATLENNLNLSLEKSQAEFENIFNAEQRERNNTNLNKLKILLNQNLYKITHMHKQLEELTLKQQESSTAFALLNTEKGQLNEQIKKSRIEIHQLQELLTSETAALDRKLKLEVERLNGDVHNLENVNEKLSDENVAFQTKLTSLENENESLKANLLSLQDESEILKSGLDMLKEHSEKLSQEHQCNKERIAQLQKTEEKLHRSAREKQSSIDCLQHKQLRLEQELKAESDKIKNTDNELQKSKEHSKKLQARLQQIEKKCATTATELKETTDKYQLQLKSIEAMETELTHKSNELENAQGKASELQNVNQKLNEQLQLNAERIDECLAEKLASQNKCEELMSQLQDINRDIEFVRTQYKSVQTDMERLVKELETQKSDKINLQTEIKDGKRELQRANDNVTELIQQVASIRLEKEGIVEENNLLRKQQEDNGKLRSSSETKLNTIVERSQSLERNLLTAENELKALRSQYEKSQATAEKLCADNKKLRDTQETLTKRVEKQAIKLGDLQARCAKLDRDNDKLFKLNEAHTATADALQREKDALHSDNKLLRERLSKAERAQELFSSKLQTLELTNAALEEAKQKLEASESDAKTKLNKFEKMREANEEKLRKLNNSLNNSESANVRLNLEIGALNSQLIEMKNTVVANHQEQITEIKKHQLEAEEQANTYKELSQKLESEMALLNDENTSIKDKLSKITLSLSISKEKCDEAAKEMEQMRENVQLLREERSQFEQNHKQVCAKLDEYEKLNKKLIVDKETIVNDLDARVTIFKTDLSEKVTECEALHKEVERLRILVQEKIDSNARNIEVDPEMETLRTRLAVAEAVLEKEQKTTAQLRLDNQILQAKYRESKQRATEESITSEERIKENRLELEGKLEKMKNKMKTLYTEEITKMKTKQERETAGLKTEMDVLKAQNKKYDEHTRKLSAQIMRLNDKILEHQKDNIMMSTKLKHLEEHQETLFKRPHTLHVSSSSTTAAGGLGLAAAASAACLPANLAMEDEEGEVFNNTYLTDLKTGRMSELMSREICTEELQYRNSLLPPHLKSTYAAQYDNCLAEDELKDGPHSFDDSMSALLSTTAGGTRKKISGVTHYKRPGPPTPSKNGGRLSFGGGSEPTREILKETYDGNTAAVSSTSAKTPARFNFFTSRFSMGNAKDEVTTAHNGNVSLRKAMQKKNFKMNVAGGVRNVACAAGMICTSTPRKSKTHFDQRRLLDEMLKSSSPSPSHSPVLAVAPLSTVSPPEVSFIETPVTTHERPLTHMHVWKQKQQAMHRRRSSMLKHCIAVHRFSQQQQAQLVATTSSDDDDDAMSDLSTPAKIKSPPSATSSGAIIAALQRRLRMRAKRPRSARPSLNLCGNIFAKYRTPNRAIVRDLNRRKARKQRNDCFNRWRMPKAAMTTASNYDKTGDESDDVADDDASVIINENENEIIIPNKTRIIIKREKNDSENEDYDEQQLALVDNNNLYRLDAKTEAVSNNDEIDNADDEPQKIAIKKELVSSQDLVEFDKRMGLNGEQGNNLFHRNENDESEEEIGDSVHFEKLVMENESRAPFEVKHIQFSLPTAASPPPQSRSTSTTHSDHTEFGLSSAPCSTVISTAVAPTTPNAAVSTPTTATPLYPNTSSVNSEHLSRIIYGGSVIYNRRLPNVNTTYVRKSSIYIKNNDPTVQDDIILVTNQTITLVDLLRMWKQMSNSARLTVAFAVLASVTTLLGLFVTFFAKH